MSAQQSQAKWNQENLHFFCKFFCDKNGLVSASNGEFVQSRRTYSIWEIYVPWVWNIVSKCWIFAWARFNFAWRLEFVKEFWTLVQSFSRPWVTKWKIQSFLYQWLPVEFNIDILSQITTGHNFQFLGVSKIPVLWQDLWGIHNCILFFHKFWFRWRSILLWKMWFLLLKRSWLCKSFKPTFPSSEKEGSHSTPRWFFRLCSRISNIKLSKHLSTYIDYYNFESLIVSTFFFLQM